MSEAQIDLAKLQTLTGTIGGVELPSFERLNSEQLENRKSRATEIINTQTETKIQATFNGEFFEFKLSELFYISWITFTSLSEDKRPKLNVEILLPNSNEWQKTKTLNASDSKNKVHAVPKQVIEAFRVKKESVFNKNQTLSEIGVFGYPSKSFSTIATILSKAANDLKDVQNEAQMLLEQVEKSDEKSKSDYVSRADSLKEKEETHTEKISALTAEITTLKSSIEEHEAENLTTIQELKSVTENLEAKKNKVESLTAKSLELENQITQSTEQIQKNKSENTQLITDQTKLKSEIRTLSNDRNLFTEDIKGFSQQGNGQIILYCLLITIPLFIFIILGTHLMMRTDALFKIVIENPEISLEKLLIPRIPIAMIAIGLLTGCFKIIKLFTNRIMEIHKQRLALAKLSIVAKDVSDSSANGLDLSAQEIHDLKTVLRMKLIKAHLADEIMSSDAFSLPTEVSEPKKKLSKLDALNSSEKQIAPSEDPVEVGNC